MAKSEYMHRNEKFVSNFERKTLIFGGSNGVTGDSNLLLSPQDRICPISMLQASRIPGLKIILRQRIRMHAVSG